MTETQGTVFGKQIVTDRFVAEMHGKSDRAVAILGAALLDTHMAQLLRGFMIEGDREVDNLLREGSVLGSLSARISVAYVLGLISPLERADLVTIQRIRELFASELEDYSFRQEPVLSWCEGLQLPKTVMISQGRRTPRELFAFATALLSQQLAQRCDMAEAGRRGSPDELRRG
jgi:DNA-binding MltR family transcriptional regulator